MLLSAAGGLGLVVMAAIKAAAQGATMAACTMGSFGLMVAAGATWQAIEKRRELQQKADLTPLDGMVAALHATLVSGGGKQFSEPQLRICVHVPEGDHFVQLTEYFNGKFSSGKTGRRVRCEKGVVGEAIRTGKTTLAKVPRNTDRIDYLVSSCGYTREEAVAVRSNANSWIAVLVGQPDCIIGIIFCDAVPPTFFGNKNGFRWNVLHATALGVADYISDRYK